MSRILVVEDEPGIALALETDLELEGHEVEVTGDGRVASERAREEAFDLILLDLMLPGKDGFEVCRELRRAGVKTPILMLTARTQEAEKVLGLELGADDYVTKPFSPLELRARVKALLRRATDSAGDTLRCGELEIDLGRVELRIGGRPVALTPLEFKLLAALARRRGRTLSRDELLDQVWGEDTFITDRVIDNHVANLRKKIEPDPEQPTRVVSVRGVGYRLDA
ncbi:MAG: response regulator transcription factor [Thermoanaerobaculia bacterium]|nr:response regulator transcription factor [Thermoanaerobaculia bacterium]